MADNMGIPKEQLLQTLYKAEVQRKAQEQVNKALREGQADPSTEEVKAEAGSPTP